MKTFSIATLLALPLGALGIYVYERANGAIQITSPDLNSVWNSTGAHTVTWTYVSYIAIGKQA